MKIFFYISDVTSNFQLKLQTQKRWELLQKRILAAEQSQDIASENELFRSFSLLFARTLATLASGGSNGGDGGSNMSNIITDRKTPMLQIAENANGNHCIQKALSVFSGKWLMFVIDRLQEV